MFGDFGGLSEEEVDDGTSEVAPSSSGTEGLPTQENEPEAMEVAVAAVGGTADDVVQEALLAHESAPAPEAMDVPTADVERLNTVVTAVEVGMVFTSQAASATSIAGEFRRAWCGLVVLFGMVEEFSCGCRC